MNVMHGGSGAGISRAAVGKIRLRLRICRGFLRGGIVIILGKGEKQLCKNRFCDAWGEGQRERKRAMARERAKKGERGRGEKRRGEREGKVKEKER